MLMNRALGRGGYGGGGVRTGSSGTATGTGGYGGYGPGAQKKKKLDPNNPKDVEYLRRMHPDFDEVMGNAEVDYKTRSETDANFEGKFRIPPPMEPTRTFREHVNSVDAVCWGPEPGQFVSASHDKTLKVWDAASGRCLETLAGHSGGIYHCAAASNRKLVVSCGAGSESNLLLWQWAQKKSSMKLAGHQRSVIHATFSPDSQCTSTLDQDGNVLIHDLASGKCTFSKNAHYGMGLCSSFCKQDGNLLCTAGYDGCIHVLDLREEATRQVWQLPSTVANWSSASNVGLCLDKAHGGYPVHAVECTGPTEVISGGADNTLKRWDLRMLGPRQAPHCAWEYLGHTAAIRSLCVSNDTSLIVSGCEDGSCRVWQKDPLTQRQGKLAGLKKELEQAAAPDARRKREEISSEKASVDSLKNDGYSEAVRGLFGHVAQVSCCAWQEDGRGSASILSSSWDQTVQLFQVSLKEFQ